MRARYLLVQNWRQKNDVLTQADLKAGEAAVEGEGLEHVDSLRRDRYVRVRHVLVRVSIIEQRSQASDKTGTNKYQISSIPGFYN